MAVQSIRAAVQVRDTARDHFLGAPKKMSFGKMNGVGEVNNLPKEVRPCPKALDDARHLLASGTSAPIVIGGGGFACRFVVFDDSNFRFHIER